MKKIRPSADGSPEPRNVRLVPFRKKDRMQVLVPLLILVLLAGMTTLAAGCGRASVLSDGTGTAVSSDTTPGDATASANATSEATPATDTSSPELSATSEPSATPEPSRSGTKFPDFSMKDLDGNVVDQSLFANKDLTMVNIWGTFCPPCIDEMPDLGKLAKVMASDYNAQLVGLVVDISDEDTLALAKEILSQSDATHLNLIPDEAVTEFLKQFEYVPTTLFVDKDGYILSQPVVGGHSYADYLVLVKDLLKK